MSDSPNPQDAARTALLNAIPDAIEKLQKHGGPAQATGLKELAEAYAWLVVPNQVH